MRITKAGNIGIGTDNPTSTLTVAGNVYAREIKVDINAGADIVFSPTTLSAPSPKSNNSSPPTNASPILPLPTP